MTAPEKDALPQRALSTATAFVNAHGGSGRAVVENMGRAGVRVVLIGADGGLGDVIVDDVATGESLVEAVDGLTASEWDSETTSALTIGAEHRRRMAGPRAR